MLQDWRGDSWWYLKPSSGMEKVVAEHKDINDKNSDGLCK